MALGIQHSEVMSSSIFPRASTPSDASFGGTTFSTGRRRLTPAQRAKQLFKSLIDLVQSEWKTIRALNLGVRSGTGIVDELLLQKLHRWVKELHLLCISKVEASDVVAKMATRLEHDDFQQLQVMLDTADHTELSDYLRLMRFNTSDPFASTPIGIIEKRPPSLASSSSRLNVSSKSRASVRHKSMVSRNPARLAPFREEHIRFAGFLPEDHALSQAAYSLYRSRLPAVCLTGDGGAAAEARRVAEAEREALAATVRAYPLADLLGPCDLRASLLPPPGKTRPIELEDLEARWYETLHTHVDRDVLLSNIVIKNPYPVWQNPPAFVQQREAAAIAVSAAAAAAAAKSKLAPSTRETRETAPRTPGGTWTQAGSFLRTASVLGGKVPPSPNAASGAGGGDLGGVETSQSSAAALASPLGRPSLAPPSGLGPPRRDPAGPGMAPSRGATPTPGGAL